MAAPLRWMAPQPKRARHWSDSSDARGASEPKGGRVVKALLGTLTELRGDLESCGTGCTARVGSSRTAVESVGSGIEALITSIRPELEPVLAALLGRIDAMDAKLASRKDDEDAARLRAELSPLRAQVDGASLSMASSLTALEGSVVAPF